MRAAITVSDLCDLYLADAKSRIKASTWAMDRSRIETHVKPLIGRFTVRSLTTADIERMKAEIIAGKTAKPRKASGRGGVATGGPGVAARTLGMTGTILEYAKQTLKLIKDNPSRGVKKPPDRKQKRFLTLEEITKLGQAMREAETAGENDDVPDLDHSVQNKRTENHSENHLHDLRDDQDFPLIVTIRD